MHQILAHLAHFFISLGGLGLLLLAILDSSFLFLPLGNDLLLVLMTTQHPEKMVYYAFMSAAGSTIGCLLTDLLSRKGGKEGLKGRVSERRLIYVQSRVEKHAGLFLAFAALMPPPFPFTVFVIVASALDYPRAKLLGIIVGTRAARFLIEGALAVHFGRHILAIAGSPTVQGVILVIVVISIVGSAWSIYSWIRRSAWKRV
jgi:membrane protein YqaA with SNARE-associated domain